MFVQVIKGKTNDEAALRQRFDDWTANLSGQAEGWLGTTAGTADDGTFLALVQFESAEAARRNSERPEQGEWWSQTEPLLADAQFEDAEEVVTFLNGADDGAQFVQVMDMPVKDRDRARALGERATQELPSNRPDVLGGVVAMHGDRATQAVYFSDEAAARAGESQGMSPEQEAQMAEMSEIFGEPSYLDLRNVWHARP